MDFNYGITPGVAEADYRAFAAVNVSALKPGLRGSLADIRYAMDNPMAQTPAMALGTACHCYILEPVRFFKTYVVKPKIDKRSNAGKAESAAWDEAHAGATIIEQDAMDAIISMGKALEAHPRARPIIKAAGDRECVAVWDDPKTGIKCKARADFANLQNGLILDLKTAKDATQRPFEMQAAKLAYHMQAAWYRRGFNLAGDRSDYDFVFIVVEPTGRNRVGVYTLEREDMELGERHCDEILYAYSRAVESGVWTDPSHTAQRLQLPAYMHQLTAACAVEKVHPATQIDYSTGDTEDEHDDYDSDEIPF